MHTRKGKGQIWQETRAYVLSGWLSGTRSGQRKTRKRKRERKKSCREENVVDVER